MKKLTVLVSEVHANKALLELRNLGLVHVKHMREPVADKIVAISNKVNLIEKVLILLDKLKREHKDVAKEKINSYLKEVIILDKERQRLDNKLITLERKKLWFSMWGDISQSALVELKNSGVFVKLYQCTKAQLKALDKDKMVYVLRKDRGVYRIAFIATSQDESLGFDQVELPSENLHSLEKKLSAVSYNLEAVDKKLVEIAGYKYNFVQFKKELLSRLEFYRVRFGMAYKDDICCLQGFCPKEAIDKINRIAKIEGWATVVEEPDDPEEVPTLIRNPKWIEMIKPVFKFMGTLPGYKEYDISFCFLFFFSIFFAMLIGDAGYGIIFLVATFFIQRKFGSKLKEGAFLMYVLSLATIFWGAATGTWFGFEKIAQLPFLNFLVIQRVNSFLASNQIFMIYLCFIIGAIHLSIAHLIVAFRFSNSLKALGQIGWVCIIWGAFFIAGSLVLDKPMPDFILLLGIIGFMLIILFSNPQRNILKGMLISLADLPLKTITSFSDVISYLRLFAVGYATVAVATTFNGMAYSTGFSNIFTSFISACILFLGHSLNMILGLMAVIVHGIRLNMLEFSGHLNMQWSGKEYEPFRDQFD